MKQELMAFLNSGSHIAGDEHFDIGQPGTCSAIFAEKRNRFDLQVSRCQKSSTHILASTTGGKCSQHIPWFAEGSNLPRKNLVKLIIVSDGSQVAPIGCQ